MIYVLCYVVVPFVVGFALGYHLERRTRLLRKPIMLPVRGELNGRSLFNRAPDRVTRLADGTVLYDWSETRDVQ